MQQQDSSREFVARAMARAKFNRRAIQFLIDLSEADEIALAADEAALLNFMAGVYEFGFNRGGNTYIGQQSATEYVRQLAARIQANPEILGLAINVVHALLAAAADDRDVTVNEPFAPDTKLIFLGSRRPHITLVWAPTSDKELAQALAFGTGKVLQSEEGEMVRRCKWDNCRLGPRDKEHPEGQRRIFLANSPRQEYCGRQCSTAASFLRFKEKHEEATAIHAAPGDQNASTPKRSKRRRKLGATAPPKALPAESTPESRSQRRNAS